MVLNNSIEKNEDSLLMLDDSLPQASVDRFVFGLQQRKWKEWDILCNQLKEHISDKSGYYEKITKPIYFNKFDKWNENNS